jgi:hypothetical protein
MTPSRSRRPRVAVLLGTAALVPLAGGPVAASAAVTTTHVDTPAAETILEAPGTSSFDPDPVDITVAGTAPGAAPGDLVDVVCTWTLTGEPVGLPLAEDVPVGADGRFSAVVAKPIHVCRLRAVPADAPSTADDSALAPYTGPRVIGGEFSVRRAGQDGTSFRSVRSQRGGIGQVDGLRESAATETPTLSFSDNASGIRGSAYVDGTRGRSIIDIAGYPVRLGRSPLDPATSQLTVDGTPATVAVALGQQRMGLVSKRLDPDTGDLEVVESAPVGLIVPDPVTGDPALRPSGIDLVRTYVQDHDGRLFTFRDVLRSTDGAAHRVSVTYGAAVAEGSSASTFRIPWQTGEEYRATDEDTTIAAAPAGSATIYARIAASTGPSSAPVPDSGGEAAFAFDTAPSDGRFVSEYAFVVRLVRDVPAGGSATITHRYAHATSRTELDALLGTPGPPVGIEPTPPPAPLPLGPVDSPLLPRPPAARPAPADPLARLHTAARKVLLTRGQAARLRGRKTITVTVKGVPAGRYGVTVRRASRRGTVLAAGATALRADGTLKLRVRPSAVGRRWFATKAGRRRTLKAHVTVSWAPKGTEPRTRASRLTLRAR